MAVAAEGSPRPVNAGATGKNASCRLFAVTFNLAHLAREACYGTSRGSA